MNSLNVWGFGPGVRLKDEKAAEKKKYFKYKSMCCCGIEALYMRCYRFENNRHTKLRNYS